jgi:hypothetical protein
MNKPNVKQCIRVPYPQKTILNFSGKLILIAEPNCNYTTDIPLLIHTCDRENVLGIFKSRTKQYVIIDTVEPGKWNLSSDERELQIKSNDIDTVYCVCEMILI